MVKRVEYIKMPSSRFIKVECKNCKNVQIIFNKAATVVKCVKCGEVLAEPRGGLVGIKNARVLSVLS